MRLISALGSGVRIRRIWIKHNSLSWPKLNWMRFRSSDLVICAWHDDDVWKWRPKFHDTLRKLVLARLIGLRSSSQPVLEVDYFGKMSLICFDSCISGWRLSGQSVVLFHATNLQCDLQTHHHLTPPSTICVARCEDLYRDRLAIHPGRDSDSFKPIKWLMGLYLLTLIPVSFADKR